MDNLVFRRQFIMSDKKPEILSGRVSVSTARYRSLFIQTHPDLELCRHENESYELIMLGYALDPMNPGLSNLDILKKLSAERTFKDILKASESLNGRFVIIYNDDISVKLFNDATGFREVYYYISGGTIACGSSSNIIAKHLQAERQKRDTMDVFLKSPAFRSESAWIGNETPYEGIMHLPPNHYLDITGNKVERFWPYAERSKTKLSDAADIMATLLKGTYEAAVKRYKLHQGLTSGWDTRVLLAASRQHVKEIKFYFLAGFKNEKQGVLRDRRVAVEIAEKTGIPLDIYNFNEVSTDPQFEKIFYANNILARPKLLLYIYNSYRSGYEDTYTVSGTMGNEILRIMSSLNRDTTDPLKIAKIIGYDKLEYPVAAISEWLKDSAPLLSELNYVPVDMFFWEQFFGNWGALSASEQDICRDEIRPFNNRKFLYTYTSLDDKHRYRDYPMGHVKIIERLWKELLDFKMDIDMYGLKKILRAAGLEQLTEKLYQRLK